MAQYDTHLTGSISSLISYIDQAVLNGSMTASQEGGCDLTCGDVRCVTRVYERYSWWGGQRLSLTVTIFGRDGSDEITADDVADQIGTIGYEVTCLGTPRVPRVYIRDGEVVSIQRPLID